MEPGTSRQTICDVAMMYGMIYIGIGIVNVFAYYAYKDDNCSVCLYQTSLSFGSITLLFGFACMLAAMAFRKRWCNDYFDCATISIVVFGTLAVTAHSFAAIALYASPGENCRRIASFEIGTCSVERYVALVVMFMVVITPLVLTVCCVLFTIIRLLSETIK